VFHSANPTLREEMFETPEWAQDELARREQRARFMTIGGTVNASMILIGVCAAAAVGAWAFLTAGEGSPNAGLAMPFAIGGAIVGLVMALIISFKPKSAPFLSPVYALVEGVFLAGFSYFVAANWVPTGEGDPNTGLIFQAVGLTFAIFAGMLISYKAGLIRVGPVVQKIMITALGGLILYSVALMLMNGIFGMGMPNLYASASPIGIGFTAICLGLASLFLVMDFQFIEEQTKRGAPKYMEWYAAFGLLVTLVWVYVEVLRLLAKIQSRD